MAAGGDWNYPNFPNGWRFIGSGGTSAAGKPLLDYEREEQFLGPDITRAAAKNIVRVKFEKLTDNGIITMYKIRDNYMP